MALPYYTSTQGADLAKRVKDLENGGGSSGGLLDSVTVTKDEEGQYDYQDGLKIYTNINSAAPEDQEIYFELYNNETGEDTYFEFYKDNIQFYSDDNDQDSCIQCFPGRVYIWNQYNNKEGEGFTENSLSLNETDGFELLALHNSGEVPNQKIKSTEKGLELKVEYAGDDRTTRSNEKGVIINCASINIGGTDYKHVYDVKYILSASGIRCVVENWYDHSILKDEMVWTLNLN